MEIFTYLVMSSAEDGVDAEGNSCGIFATIAGEPSRRETGSAESAAMNLRRDIIPDSPLLLLSY